MKGFVEPHGVVFPALPEIGIEGESRGVRPGGHHPGVLSRSRAATAEEEPGLARTRAEDYDDKRALIFERAAELFAESGFARASIADLAAPLPGVQVLDLPLLPVQGGDPLRDPARPHGGAASRGRREALGGGEPPQAQLRRLLARAHGDLRARPGQAGRAARTSSRLPARGAAARDPRPRAPGRRLVAGLLRPARAPGSRSGAAWLEPTAMLLFGMINWTYTWYRPEGALAPEQLADLAADLFLERPRGRHARSSRA